MHDLAFPHNLKPDCLYDYFLVDLLIYCYHSTMHLQTLMNVLRACQVVAMTVLTLMGASSALVQLGGFHCHQT